MAGMTRRLSIALATAALAALPLFADGGRHSSTASMNVSATVLARTMLSIDQQPSSIEVTAADVARGYVELPGAVRFSLRTNARGGTQLDVAGLDQAFTEMKLRWDDRELVVGRGVAGLLEPYRAPVVEHVADVRLALAAGTEPGTYPFSVQMNATPLY